MNRQSKEPVVLLKTKLNLPVIRSVILSRSRLLKKLDNGTRCRLTLMSAPAGYGKTTLLCDWLRANGSQAAWISLEKEDNDPVRFFSYLIAAFQGISSPIGKFQADKINSPKAPDFEKLLTLFINELSGIDGQTILVLDDYHLIDSRKIHDMIEFFIEHRPPQIQVLISTRSDPPLALARLRSQLQLMEIRSADLSFSIDETAGFIRSILKLDLTDEDLSLLDSKTEGWIAGLQLAAFSMQNRRDISGFIKNFQADNRYIADYLMEEVLSNQPEHVQQFLLQTCILDRMSAPLCDNVTGRNDSREMLVVLENSNLFIFPLDKKRKWYRYHQLFGDLLKHKLRHDMEARQIAGLHRSASEWYENHGLPGEAVKQILLSGDYDSSADLICRSAEQLLLHGNLATLKNWIDALPESVLSRHPKLYVYHAMTMIFNSHPVGQAESRIKDAIKADRDNTISGEISAFHGLIAAYKGHSRKSIELCEKALSQLSEEDLFFRSFTTGYLGLNYLYFGNIVPARRAFDEAVKIAKKTGNLMISVLARTHLAELFHLEGKLADAKSMYEKACDSSLDEGGRQQSVAGIALIGLGNIYREWNEIEMAADYLQKGVELADRWGDIGVLHGYIGLSRIKQIQGDWNSAEALLLKAQEIARDFDAMKFDDRIVANYRARYSLMKDEFETAREWIREYKMDVFEKVIAEVANSISYMRMFELSTLVRVYIQDGNADKAAALLKSMIEISQQNGWIAFEIDNDLCMALAQNEMGYAEAAQKSLEQCLNLAVEGRFIRLFLDEGQVLVEMISELLRSANSGKKLCDYMKCILAVSDKQSGMSGKDDLSDRELEVLQLISRGMTNQEIGDQLFISLNTVRTHTKNINNKLNVHNRTQAIVRAREKGVI